MLRARVGGLRKQLRIVTQHRLLQPVELRPRVDPQPVGQQVPRLLQRRQRLGLAAVLVLRAGQQRPACLARRRLPQQGRRVGQHLMVPTRAQVAVDPQLLRLLPHLPQPRRLHDGRLPVVHVRERTTTPQVQRLADEVPRPVDLPHRRQVPGTGHGPLEAHRVDGVIGDGQPVPRRRRLDGLRPQQPSQPRDTAVQDLLRRGRWLVAPQRVDQEILAHHLPCPRRQSGEHDAVPATERGRLLVHRESAEHSDIHVLSVRPRA